MPVAKTLVLVQKANGNEAQNWSNIFRWYSQFWEGRELVDDERGGRPKIELNWGKHGCCCWFGEKWLTNCIENVVLRILKEDLGKTKLYACFAPHSLTLEQRGDWVISSQGIVVVTGVVNLPMPPICSASCIVVKIPHCLSQQTLNNMGSNGLQWELRHSQFSQSLPPDSSVTASTANCCLSYQLGFNNRDKE